MRSNNRDRLPDSRGCAGTGTDATQAAAVTLNLAYTMASTTAIDCPAGLDAYVNTAGSVVRTVGPGTVAAAPQFVNLSRATMRRSQAAT